VIKELEYQFINALLSGNKQTANQVIVDARTQGARIARIYLDIISPSQVHIGELWHNGSINRAQENLATLISLDIMDTLIKGVVSPQPHGFRAVVTPVEGDSHFIGARMLADFLIMDGWDVDFLSNPTSTSDLVEFVQRRPTDIVALSSTLPKSLPNAKVTAEALYTLNPAPKILLGGAALNSSDLDVQSLSCDAIGLNAIEGLREARRSVGLVEYQLTLKDHLVSIGHRIKLIRLSYQITQKQLADRSGIARAYISMVEQGKQNLTIGAILKIADALGVSLNELMTFSGKEDNTKV